MWWRSSPVWGIGSRERHDTAQGANMAGDDTTNASKGPLTGIRIIDRIDNCL